MCKCQLAQSNIEMSSRKRATNRVLPEYRKNEDLENLFVFGYHCKLFRDDERASFIDAGRHLIPWMGDSTLQIDRYDGRGHLHDLKLYDTQHCSTHHDRLSAEEKHIEQLCDEERYLELNSDLAEREIYEEEELKRLNEALESDSGYGAVGFSYESGGVANQEEANQMQGTADEDQDGENDAEDPYIPIPQLQVPTTMHPPATMKQHAIIEKTALFTSKQGVQMEIVIKTKQQNNPLFSFLNYDDELNAYYRHVLTAIRKGRYTPKPTEMKRRDSEGEGSGYLHPSLMKQTENPVETAASRQEFLSSVSSKLPAGQIANTPYAKLLSNLSKHRASSEPALASSAKANVLTGNGHSSSQYSVADGRGEDDEEEDGEFTTAPGQPPPPGMGPPEPLPAQPLQPMPMHSHSNLDDLEVHTPSIIPPPPSARPMVDRMAEYVARNGPEFEIIVRVKRDDKFQFLETWHPYHAYYNFKKESLIKEMKKANGEDEDETKQDDDADSNSNKAVSFSIKTKEAENNSNISSRPTALPYESSEDEDESDGTPKKSSSQCSPSTAQAAPVTQMVPVSRTASPLAEVKSGKLPSAEDKFRDRISAAAREKLALAGKEKQVQAERKRKAALFISMLNRAKVASVAGSGAAHAPESASPSSPAAALENPPSPTPSSSNQSPVPYSPVAMDTEVIRTATSRSCSKSPKPLVGPIPRPASPVRRDASSASITQLSRQSSRSRSRSRSGSKRSRKSPVHSRRRSPSHPKKKSSRRRSRSKSRKSTRRRRRSGSRHRSRSHHQRSKRSRSRSPRRHSRSSKSKRKRRERSRSRSPKRKPKFVAIPELSENTPSKQVVELSPSSSDDNISHTSSQNQVTAERSESVHENWSSGSDDGDTEARRVEVCPLPPGGMATTAALEPVAAATSLYPPPPASTTVSSDLMSRVRAMLKASRQTVLQEEKMELQILTPPGITVSAEEGEESSSSSVS